MFDYFQQNVTPLIKEKKIELRSNHYRNVSTDPLGTSSADPLQSVEHTLGITDIIGCFSRSQNI